MIATLAIASLAFALAALVLAIRMGGMRAELERVRDDAETYRDGLAEANEQARMAHVARQQVERRLRREIDEIYAEIDETGDDGARARVAVAGLRRLLSATTSSDD